MDRLERAVTLLTVRLPEDGESEDEEDEESEDDGDGDTETDEATQRSKYQDVESVLKYIEDDDGKSAVKLVIMNFND